MKQAHQTLRLPDGRVEIRWNFKPKDAPTLREFEPERAYLPIVRLMKEEIDTKRPTEDCVNWAENYISVIGWPVDWSTVEPPVLVPSYERECFELQRRATHALEVIAAGNMRLL